MSWHPASPINIEEGYRDLEATPPRSTTNSTEDVAPLPASTPPTQVQQASRRRGATGAGGGDVAEGNEFTGDEDGDAAQQARLHMHVAIDMAALQQAAALTGENAPTESVNNRGLVILWSPYCPSVDGGPARYIVTVGTANHAGPPTPSVKHSRNYAKLLLALFGVCLSACSATFPVVKQAAPDGLLVLAYGLLVALALVLLAGLLATSFDRSPSSAIWGRYALQLALGLIIGFLTWSVCSLKHGPGFDVAVGIAGALAYIAVVLLFHTRKW
ncbi:hypothetical protein PAHAL_2G037200 [Panicum hallii]|uniref:Uncharacterized protein n=1 Tax=Panicum hallii TaxID=206008 RepID=A0A2S3GVR9_9POAL|nr:uncharacterized protein LOC112882521 isoform X2 [Panicum hallii]PAN09613.1 hypothetical protein PAHAL_2G037200 [Panicum hallii]